MPNQTITFGTIANTKVNAYNVNGKALISKSEACYASRHNKSTAPFDRFLERTAADPSHTKEFQAKVEAERTAQNSLTEVPRTQGGTSQARLVDPDLVFAFWLDESNNTRVSEGCRARTTNLVFLVGSTGLTQLANEAAGIQTTASQVAHEGIRILDDSAPVEPSDNANRIKRCAYNALRPGLLDDIKPRYLHKCGLPKQDRWFDMHNICRDLLLNAMSRIAPEMQPYLKKARKQSGTKCYGQYKRSYEELLSSKAKARYAQIASAYEMAFDLLEYRYPLTTMDLEAIERAVDKQFPRM